ncbi:terpene synthase 10-like [Senna tora]|uniref:Terpene synthase 10-like n=1 Tax=Senna tora TaxID=362788 RepID=A0A834TRN7_9FABA|nr:terpene synthase 10-like [Senna tora]
MPQTKSSVFSIKSTYVLPTTHRHEYSKTPTSSSTIQIIVPPNQNNNNVRRSANYQPSTWRYEDIQSLTTQYGEESYVEEREGLKEEVRMMISKMEDNERLQLELIDALQKLGVASHFMVEISGILQNVYTNNQNQNDLYATALQFRLLRQHGYHVSSEIFRRFQDDEGEFNNTQELWKDIEGMVELYEASFHGMEGESILDEATHFCSNLLKEYVDEKKKKEMKNERSVELVSQALEIPLHWRVPRLESIWYIQFYQKEDQKKSAIITPALLQLAKLDFNIVQATHQQDLKHISR